MAIKIIPEPDIYLTETQLEHARNQYDLEYGNWHSVSPPPSFEVWLRNKTKEAS